MIWKRIHLCTLRIQDPDQHEMDPKHLFKTFIVQANSEIIMYEGMTCLYKSNVDLFFYIIGSGIKSPPVANYVLRFKKNLSRL